jgi:hypothetical protein
MRSSRWAAIGAVVCLGAGLLALGNAASHGQAPVPKAAVVWEYSTQFGANRQDHDEMLNQAGQDGWELVAVSDDPRELVRYTFKRPKQK